MDGLEMQIALTQARLTSVIKSGEPEDSPQVRQMEARLERMRRLWATHRRIRLGMGTSEDHHVRRVN
jgi:capsule polysaccharide export protein KpsE/RkpR